MKTTSFGNLRTIALLGAAAFTPSGATAQTRPCGEMNTNQRSAKK